MASISPLTYQQQPQDQVVSSGNNPEPASSSNSWHNSGSIGPFFGVISVLVVLSILSCFLGRVLTRKEVSPLQGDGHGSCFGWLRRRLDNARFMSRCEGENNGATKRKIIAGEESNNDCKDQPV